MPVIAMHNIFKTIDYFTCDLWLFFFKYAVCANPYNGVWKSM